LNTASIAALALLAPLATAQIETVPMKGIGNEWVKNLELRGRSDWEWLETYPEQVYFATRVEAERNGDIVTMWMRTEYKNPQSPSAHKSVASRDDWDCVKRQRSTRGLIFYKWNNLEADEPIRSTNLLRYWEKIKPGTIGETLLNFACSIKNIQPVIAPKP
ncbi:MAG: surface-adhesin E family protein, partial [Steroidobacteraceae bacterium]